jgi:hypothetical protein
MNDTSAASGPVPRPAVGPPRQGSPPNLALGLAAPWFQLWRDAGAWGYGLMAVGLYCNARQLRRTVLTDLTRTTDQYLRSPAFLEILRCTLRSAASSKNPLFPFQPR